MNRGTAILIGLAWLAFIVIAYPYVLPALQSITDIVLDVTGITTGLPHLIFNSMPYWGLGVAILGALVMIIYGGRDDK